MKSSWKDFTYRLFHWEYWSTRAIYLPLSPFWVYFSIRSGSLFFFEKTNPGIPFGGMAMTPKSVIYNLLPQEFIPKTGLVSSGQSPVKVAEKLGLKFPLIAKPDYGLKGLGVEIIKNESQLEEYGSRFQLPFLVQEKIPFSKEVGIFYCKLPHSPKGFVTGIVKKNFLKIVGDGVRTFRELVEQNPRSRFQFKRLEKIWKSRWEDVLVKGEEVILLEVGSHTRGSEFLNYSHLINEKLEARMEDIASQTPGFYYGRFDVLYRDEGSLSNGKNFKIIELNGAMSEPTHIYDPKNSIWFAWKEILRHWSLMSQIAIQNKNVQIQTTPFSKGLERFFSSLSLEKKLKKQLEE